MERYWHHKPQIEDGRLSNSDKQNTITLRSEKESADTLGRKKPVQSILLLIHVESLDGVPPPSSFMAIGFDLRGCDVALVWVLASSERPGGQ